MIAWQSDKKNYIWMFLLLLVLGSNFLLYRSPISNLVLPEEKKWVLLGSLIDLTIISPLLVLAIYRKKKYLVKRFITLMASGLILAKFLIPAESFESFAGISYTGFVIEGLLLLLEFSLLFILMWKMPAIIQQVRMSEDSLLFSFPDMVKGKVGSHPIVKIVSSELVMIYYAFFSWKKSSPVAERNFSLHKNSSLLAFYIMIIHAIIIETIGIHWWLHEKSMVLSIVLLILNIYSVIFFLGDIQAVRLNPVKMTDDRLYLSLGLAKKMVLSFDDIECITIDKELLEKKIDEKTTIEFMARDFDIVHPHMILELKRPCSATLLLGIEKKYTRVAIRMDDPIKFHKELKERISKSTRF